MVAVTGANGYVGARIVAHLRASGEEVVALVRRPAPEDPQARAYTLGEPLAEGTLDGVDAVVHAAYDLHARGKGVRTVNYAGSLPLLDGVAARGGRAVLISSLAAFDGARSAYGQVKLELERAVLGAGGAALRCGVVFGARAGGLFGNLQASLAKGAVVPMIGGGWQRLFVTHDEHLGALVAEVLGDRGSGGGPVSAADGGPVSAADGGPVFAAHEVPTNLRAIALAIARANGRKVTPIPVPTWAAYGALRSAELAGARLQFRSDSVVSLANPAPLDQVAALRRGPIDFPPLDPALWQA
jgi:nucleoside-diphosphate-sugar epimerase